jgi:flagellar motor protein MotB
MGSAILLLAFLTTACAHIPQGIDYNKIAERNKRITAEMMGSGIKNIIHGIPKGEAGRYMEALSNELNRNLMKGEKGAVYGIAEEGDVVTMMLASQKLFHAQSTVPQLSAYIILNEVAKTLKSFPDCIVFVTGNDYSLSGSGGRYELEGARAEVVAQILVQRGMSGMRINAIGFQNYSPAAFITNKDDRINISVIPVVR